MKKALSRLILKMFGWQCKVTVPDLPKCVICVAPHTSNWDFIIGKLFYNAAGRHASFLIKKEWFFFPMGPIFRSMGGVPVERGRKNDMVQQMVDLFNAKDHFQLAITPEATRKRNPNWKKGFYYIAKRANVPIVLAYMDYGKKVMGMEVVFTPTDDEEADMKYIKNYFTQFTARHPENFATGNE